MKGVIVIGEKIGNNLFIEAVEFPDRSRRTTHFVEHRREENLYGMWRDCYTVYFDDDIKTPVKLYQMQNGMWLLDV